MDKPILPEEQRNPEDASGQQPAHENPAQGVGAYAAHSSYGPADLTAESWEKSKRPWNATPEGRLAIRLFSRGIMGAAFFTAGGMLNRKLMHDTGVHGMHYEEGYTAGKYDATKPFSEQDNPLKFIAKMIDTFVGKPIELTVHAVTGSEATAKNAVRFRPTKFKNFEYSTYEAARVAGKPVPDLYRGRSLGNEIVNVTFDFFCASIGDAFGRDIAGLVDPNVKKKWVKDGHVDVPEALKTMMKTTWRYVSYNGGEDWAVALPYVYFMKGQRHVIDKISPGFAYDFDRGLNGGSFKIDKQGNVIGNYNIEGMIDLQNRFTVYNMGTLAYREAYDFVDRKLKGKHAVLYGSPDKDTTNQTLTEKASNIVKWLARSVVKGGIFMTPAVPFFWITRTPQTKYRGLFIHTDEHGRAMTLNYENQATLKRVEGWRAARATGKAPQGEEPFRKYENVYANEFRPPDYSSNEATGFTRDSDVYFARYAPNPKKTPGEQFDWGNKWYKGREVNPLAKGDKPFNPYGKSHGIVDWGMNLIGRANYKAVRVADDHVNALGNRLKQSPRLDYAAHMLFSLRPQESLTRFTYSFVNASTSYTPYMYAKGEAARLWDDGKMDMATERMIDGAAALNWGEFKTGTGEVWRAILHKPMQDPEREEEARRRIKLDTSLPASVNFGEKSKQVEKPKSNWRERLIQGKPEDQPEIGADKPTTYAEKEEMREALKHMIPPSPSIN